ncbi:hypothetical protein B0J14DRAFT_576210 [Halenospora varia]|nr:hypothetical protein B0J14DRAFT_576210 [Halenospora varia]
MAMNAILPRKRHNELEPLAVDPPSPPNKRRISPVSATSLASPTIVAAHAWYLEHEAPYNTDPAAIPRRRSLFEDHQFPRRHSAVATPFDLISQLSTFTFSPVGKKLPPVPETLESSLSPEVKIENGFEDEDKDRDVHMTGTNTKQPDLEKIKIITNTKSNSHIRRSSANVLDPKSAPVISEPPYDYIHRHLWDWGCHYLGNATTADVFINPVSLRRPSLVISEPNPTSHPSNLVTIRARVRPIDPERQPFVIQRQLDYNTLKPLGNLGSPSRSLNNDEEKTVHDKTTSLRRSNGTRRASAYLASKSPIPTYDEKKRRNSCKHEAPLRSLPKGPVPIHVEYTTHYLPALAALLLSGHIRKGDTIDLPLPAPTTWRDTVSYVYTGSGEVSGGMRENIKFLAGVISF